MPSLPHHAVVHETVDAAKQINRSAANFVNAVLHTLIRRKPELTEALAQKSLNLQLGYPSSLINHWITRWGEEKTRAICQAGNCPAHTVIRPLPPASAPAECTPHPADPTSSFILPRGINVTTLEDFNKGTFVVQDAATRLAIELLELDDANIHRVWDTCAAPGGKTAQIAARLRDSDAFILATDRHDDRIVTLRDTLQRCRLDSQVTVAQLDASDSETYPELHFSAPFDRILVDAPCTNSGVLARRADARWRWTPKRLAQRIADQKALLDAIAPHLALNGKLVYSTCSIEPEENELQIEDFITRHPDFTCEAMHTMTPDEGCDGAFAACLVRH